MAGRRSRAVAAARRTGWEAARGPLLRSAGLLTFNFAAAAGLGFVFWVLAARSWPPDDIGVATALVATAMFLAGLSNLGMSFGIVRFLPAAPDRAALMNAALTLVGMAALAVGLGFVALAGIVAPPLAVLQTDLVLLVLFLLLVLFAATEPVAEQMFVADRRTEATTALALLLVALRLPWPLVLASSAAPAVIVGAWALGYLVSAGVAALVLLPRAFPGYRPIPVFAFSKTAPMIRFSAGNHVAGILGNAGPGLMPLLVLTLLGPGAGSSAAAHFYVAYAVASLLYAVPTSGATALLAEGSREGPRIGRDARRAAAWAAALLLPATLGLLLLRDPILGFFGASYLSASAVLVPLALVAWVLIPNSILATILRLRLRTRHLVVCGAGSSAVALGVAAALLPTMGLEGAGWGLLAGFATGALLASPVLRPSPGDAPPPT